MLYKFSFFLRPICRVKRKNNKTSSWVLSLRFVHFCLSCQLCSQIFQYVAVSLTTGRERSADGAGLSSITSFSFFWYALIKHVTDWQLSKSDCYMQSTDVMLHHLWMLTLKVVTTALSHYRTEPPAHIKVPYAGVKWQAKQSSSFHVI